MLFQQRFALSRCQTAVGEHTALTKDVRPVAGRVKRMELIDERLPSPLYPIRHRLDICLPLLVQLWRV